MLVAAVEIIFDVSISKEELGGRDEDYRWVTVNKLAEIVCRKNGAMKDEESNNGTHPSAK